jgi:hypothetical protein
MRRFDISGLHLASDMAEGIGPCSGHRFQRFEDRWSCDEPSAQILTQALD